MNWNAPRHDVVDVITIANEDEEGEEANAKPVFPKSRYTYDDDFHLRKKKHFCALITSHHHPQMVIPCHCYFACVHKLINCAGQPCTVRDSPFLPLWWISLHPIYELRYELLMAIREKILAELVFRDKENKKNEMPVWLDCFCSSPLEFHRFSAHKTWNLISKRSRKAAFGINAIKSDSFRSGVRGRRAETLEILSTAFSGVFCVSFVTLSRVLSRSPLVGGRQSLFEEMKIFLIKFLTGPKEANENFLSACDSASRRLRLHE